MFRVVMCCLIFFVLFIFDSECQNEIFRRAKQMVKERQDITGLNCIKGASGKVIVDDKGIKDCWKEYMEKLMNEENKWDHKISAEVKETSRLYQDGRSESSTEEDEKA